MYLDRLTEVGGLIAIDDAHAPAVRTVASFIANNLPYHLHYATPRLVLCYKNAQLEREWCHFRPFQSSRNPDWNIHVGRPDPESVPGAATPARSQGATANLPSIQSFSLSALRGRKLDASINSADLGGKPSDQFDHTKWNCDGARLAAETLVKVIVSDGSSAMTVLAPDCDMWLYSADQLAKSKWLSSIESVEPKPLMTSCPMAG